MTRNCDHCGTAYSRPPSLIGKFCSTDCKRLAMRKGADRTRRRVRYQPTHPIASKGGYVSEARAVLYDKIGPGAHTCHWCGAPIRWVVGQRGQKAGSVIADHLDSNELNDSPDNLVPSCGSCNVTRARVVREEDAHRVRANGRRLRGEERACEKCGETFVVWDAQTRFCSRSCARSAYWASRRT